MENTNLECIKPTHVAYGLHLEISLTHYGVYLSLSGIILFIRPRLPTPIGASMKNLGRDICSSLASATYSMWCHPVSIMMLTNPASTSGFPDSIMKKIIHSFRYYCPICRHLESNQSKETQTINFGRRLALIPVRG